MSKEQKSSSSIAVEHLDAIIDSLKGSTVQEITISKGSESVRIVRELKPASKAAAPAPAPTAATALPFAKKATVAADATSMEGTKDIVSPGVGVFLRARNAKSDPFLKLRDTVEKDQVVAMLRFMGMDHEIRSDIAGKIVEILVEDGQAIEYGQPLFRLK